MRVTRYIAFALLALAVAGGGIFFLTAGPPPEVLEAAANRPLPDRESEALAGSPR